jgi:DUF1009 family protein
MNNELPIAIVAGNGILPRMLAEDAATRGRPYRVVCFKRVPLSWVKDHPHIETEFEKIGGMFRAMKDAGCEQVVFAGGMARPKLNPLRFDAKFAMLSTRLLPALKKGDDATLSVIVKTFEGEGFEVVAAHQVLEGLTVGSGFLTQARAQDADLDDVMRATEITRALGRLDVGQAAVVAQGICLGVESIQGTDRMLDSIVAQAGHYLPDPKGTKGLLYKAPKPGQDWRVDLPAIGPVTVQKTAAAGLGGIVIEADSVLVLDRDEVVRAADEAGLFLWSRRVGDGL